MSKREKNGNFTYIKPTADQVEAINLVRGCCYEFHKLLRRTLPDNREAAIAITKLEEVSMWANKSIVIGE